MEAEPGRPEGECSERQEQHVTESSLPSDASQSSAPRPAHRSRGRLQHRSPRSAGLLLRFQQQQALAWQPSDSAGPSGSSFLSPSSPSSFLPSTSSARGDQGHRVQPQTSQEPAEKLSSPKRGEKKPQKPGKYVCSYCGRPCAKPSVLQKHIRSHTGERPYPCEPCGFSFKTKSNLYKHRKSHAHRIKAGLMSCREELSLTTLEGANVGEEHEEPSEGESTESEEETGQYRKNKNPSRLQRKEETHRPEDSQAVKQRLALRLSERKRGPKASPDDPPSSSLSTSSSSLGPGSKGSTESGYYSGSGSTDLSQISPPSASAKTYAEIILGKYGRLGGQQRGGHQQQPHSSSGTEEKSISFTVPKTQVIEHITKLITINEAVVDTSEIDSVKPRRSSLSRKSSTESPKTCALKDPYAFDPKAESPGPSGVRPDAGTPEALSSVPLLRSHSLPSSTSQEHTSSSPRPMSPGTFRLCQSFDEQQAAAAEMRVGHVQRMLRRQPAIEVPLGAEQMLEDTAQSSSGKGTDRKRQPKQQLHKSPCLFECDACGSLFQHSEGYESHMGTCPGHHQQHEVEAEDRVKSGREDHSQVMMQYKIPALAVAVRKRRKEESLEEDPPSPTARTTVSSGEERSHSQSGVHSEPKLQDRKGVSVIQHTSSFEKQESVSMESQESDIRETQSQPELKPAPSTSRLIRQPNIQVPEILVTLEPDTDMPPVSPPVTVPLPKGAERVEEFQWPQRSQSLAQLPAEKLPPKKKRLRLAEAAQSSGESSFESVSMPRSPSQESNVSLTSSISVSLEDPVRSEAVLWAASSQSSQMLMVPSASHQYHQSHKEMRRSASEQTPATHQQPQQTPENRSKSFDYGSLSSQQPTTSWKERRKCLLVKHATLGDPEEEHSRADSPRPGPSHVSHQPLFSTEECFFNEEPGDLPSSDVQSLVPRDQQTSARSFSHVFPEVLHRTFYDSHSARLGTPLHHLLPLQFSSHSQALYFPFSPRPLPYAPLAPATTNRSITLSPSIVSTPYHDTQPIIATCLAQLTPVVSLVVPVRLQTHMPTYASAMYTTLSQILASTCSTEPICTTMVVMSQLDQSKLQRSYLTVPALEMKSPISLTPSLASLDEEAYGPLGAGGSKRMLSPAASLELSTEAQRHQKRVKEEGEGEQGSPGERTREGEVAGTKVEEEKNKQTRKAEDKSVKEEKKLEENQASSQNTEVINKKEGTRPVSSSYPSLHTSTSVNWCYLNYIKPNPSAQQGSQTSVYSSWSVSAYNPNLPGLSTNTALSLLCSKQRHSAETYTMATASQAKDGGMEPQETETNPTPVSPGVTVPIKAQPQHEKNKSKPKRDEEASTSKSRESSCVRIFEGGYKSSEEYVYVRGRGRGKYICGECGIRCKKPSMLKKHIRTHTDVRPYVCKHCNFAFKTKGNLTKHLKSKAHGKKCQSVGVSESSLDEPESEETGGSEEPVPEEQEDHQFSDVDESEDNDDEEEDEESTTHDEAPSSCSSDTHPSTGGLSTGSGHSHQGTPDHELPGPSLSQESPRSLWSGSGRAASPCSRRALFSRRGIRAACAFSPSSESCSPSRSLSPRLELSPAVLSLSPKTELSSLSRHVSPSPERGPSPIKHLFPLRPISPSCYRSPQTRAPPSPLGLHRRAPGLLPWESPRGAHGKEEKSGTTWEGQAFPESGLFPAAFRLSTCESYPGPQPVDNIFSHLPLHSQQARLPCVMIPIGGIQMVQARPRSHPTTPSSPTSPPIEGSSRLSFDSGGTTRTQGLRTPLDHSLVSEQTGFNQPCGNRTDLHKHKTETDSKQYSSLQSSVQTPRGSDGTPVRDTGPVSALSPAMPVAERSRGQREEPPPGGNVGEGAEHPDQST
ncbi:transcription factor HIVEP3 isoform X2 [Eucyclogobius newberryi]|uniref:transcription factor HIVEP3 isoform X2 n=1 Tax=Eucyclogobius newberryi TaxID=166745 RepID=UPI003B598613